MSPSTSQPLPTPPLRPADAHKGTFGRVLLVAGSRGMAGAAALAGQAALYGGAGLVTIASPSSVSPVIASLHPCYMTLPLTETATGTLCRTAIDVILERANDASAVGLGPGLGRSDDTAIVVREVYEQSRAPLVLDADGLNAIGLADDNLDASPVAPRVLTPHPGEFARLTGLEIGSIQTERKKLAREFAAHFKVVLVLKGPSTIITDGTHLELNQTGNNALAKGGSGDVLTGLITALLGQGMTGFEAARLGTHLHGLAADLAIQRHSPRFLTAAELLRFLDDAWQQL